MMEKIVYGKSEIKFKSYAVAVVACRNVSVWSRNVYKEIERNKLFFCDVDSNKDDDDDIRSSNFFFFFFFPHEYFIHTIFLLLLFSLPPPTQVIIFLTFICNSRRKKILFLKLPEWNDEKRGKKNHSFFTFFFLHPSSFQCIWKMFFMISVCI